MIHKFKVTLSTLVNKMSMPLSIYFRIWGLMLMTRNLSLSPPTQNLEFLGFILDSLLMTITLTVCRKVALLNACSKLLQKSCQKFWVVSTVIGMIIAALPGVKHGAIHYRILESEKTAALCNNGEDNNGCITLSPLATVKIQWWHTNISTSHHFIRAPPPDTTIYSDANLDGWGGTNSLNTVHPGRTWITCNISLC